MDSALAVVHNVYVRSWLIVAYGLQPLHPGAGRSPGLVDLPVIRDNAGYPILPRSEVKGALKEYCFRSQGCKSIDKSMGRVKCENTSSQECLRCCCLWGPEPEEGDEGASLMVVSDFVPLLYPARVEGVNAPIVYVTTPWLLRKALDMLELMCDKNKDGSDIGVLYSRIKSLYEDVVKKNKSLFEKSGSIQYLYDAILVGGTLLEKKEVEDRNIEETLASRLLRIVGIEAGDNPPVLVLPEALGRSVIEALLERRTRVSLRLDTRTVREGALWSEEYIPQGTIYIGFIAESFYINEFCKKLVAVATPQAGQSAASRGEGREKKIDPSNILCRIDEMIKGASKESTIPKYIQIAGRYSLALGVLKLGVIESRCRSEESMCSGGERS